MSSEIKHKGLSLETKITAAILIVILLVFAASAIASLTIPQHGTIGSEGVALYWDSGLTQQVTSMNWTTLNPNTTKTLITYLHNFGDNNVTYSYETSDIPSYLVQNWNYTGATAASNSIMAVEWSLSASVDAPQGASFNYNLTVTAIEVGGG